MSSNFGICILAAGLGSRLKLNCPKALAPVMGRTLIDYVLDTCLSFLKKENLKGDIGVVTGHMKELVEGHLRKNHASVDINFAFQEKQLGTADAVRSYFKGISKASSTEYTLIICADTPLIRDIDLSLLFHHLKSTKKDAVAATFLEKNPTGYGRIVRDKQGRGFHIVEEKDASIHEKNILEVNSALYIIKTPFLIEQLAKVDNKNNSGEFYLTDLFKDHFDVSPVLFEEGQLFLGVNNLIQLEQAHHSLSQRKIRNLQVLGVRFLDSSSVLIDEAVTILPGTLIYPQVCLQGHSEIAADVIIESGCVIKNSRIEEGVSLLAYSYLEDVVIQKSASIGPFARLRPGTLVGEKAKVGNFVEIKKSTLGKGAKISHLSYVGDAEIGEESNLGCGFITCNYDGINKHKTKIGKNVFIGSDSQIVAPLEIGDDCFVAAASTVTQNMPSGSFAISRGKQVTKLDMAHKFLKKK